MESAGMKNKKKFPKRAPRRPEEEALIRRWSGAKSAPTLWERLDDPVFGYNARESLGTHWGVGRPKGPRGS